MRYLLYTNLKVAIDLNPRWWSFQYMSDRDPQRPNLRVHYLRVFPLVLLLTIDNGDFKDVEL